MNFSLYIALYAHTSCHYIGIIIINININIMNIIIIIILIFIIMLDNIHGIFL